MRDVGDRHASGLRERAVNELARGTDAECAREQLAEHEALVAIEALPGCAQSRLHLGGGQPGQRCDLLLDPACERAIVVLRRWWQQKRNGLREVTDRRIARIEQPLRYAGRCQRRGDEIARSDDALEL